MKTIEGVCSDLNGVEGAMGAFVWHRGACLASSLPKTYDTSRLTQLGSGLARLGQLSHKAGYERSSSAFHWQRASLFTWPLGEAGLLAVLALPSAARGMLELSAAMAVEDLLPLLDYSADLGSNQLPASVQLAASSPVHVATQQAEWSARGATPPSATLPVAPVQSASVITPTAFTPPRPGDKLRGDNPRSESQKIAEPAPAAEPPLETSEQIARLEEIESLIVEELGPTGRALFQRAKRRAVRPGVPEATWLADLRTLVLSELTDRGVWATVATSVLWLPSKGALD